MSTLSYFLPKKLNNSTSIISACREALNIGFDYISCSADMIMSMDASDFDKLIVENRKESLRIYSCNDIFPNDISIIGPNLRFLDVEAYISKLLVRLCKLGVKFVLFDSKNARTIPEGFNKFNGCVQLEDFIGDFIKLSGPYGIKLLLQPVYNSGNNVVESIADAADIVLDIKSPLVGLMADSLNICEAQTTSEEIAKYKDIIEFCNIDVIDEESKHGYNSHFVGALKAINYDGMFCVNYYGDSIVDAYMTIKELVNNDYEPIFKYVATRRLVEEPLFLKPIEGTANNKIYALKNIDGKVFPAQNREDGCVVIASCEQGETLFMQPIDQEISSKVKIEELEDKLVIKIGEKVFSEYVFNNVNGSRPYFGKIFDDEGNSFTRLDFETREHPHHKSVFIGIGDINGIDFWNDNTSECGHVINNEIVNMVSGNAFGEFVAKTTWFDSYNLPIVDEDTTYTVYNQSDDYRYLDIKILFKAVYSDIIFGKTKEAGPLAVRLNEELRADKGTGIINNSYGGVGENECWGKAANWVDYSGKIDAINGYKKDMGVTIFDNEKNERYPTCWHVRDYGLFAANNLAFKGKVKIPKDYALEYKFRIVFHKNKFDREEISNRFVLYNK